MIVTEYMENGSLDSFLRVSPNSTTNTYVHLIRPTLSFNESTVGDVLLLNMRIQLTAKRKIVQCYWTFTCFVMTRFWQVTRHKKTPHVFLTPLYRNQLFVMS